MVHAKKEGNAMTIDKQRLDRFVRSLLLAFLLVAPGTPLAAHEDSRHDLHALAQNPRLVPGQIAPLLEGLGDYRVLDVTTSSDRARLFFEQGLRLTYAFNHMEALRAFTEAARLDPDFAMAYWGWGLVLGSNINLPMRPEVVGQAYEAIQRAVARKGKVSRKEQDYIDAIAVRYAGDPNADRRTLDKAYADAMAALHAKYPGDDDAATLYAASLMDLTPWDYWAKDRRPKHASTNTVLTVLESVMARNPRHAGALHYYIHIVEAAHPERGERAADLLRGLAPGAGHLVHMPSHIYTQVGRYAEAFEANALAAAADERYITQCRVQGIYPLNYFPHNLHFLAWTATMQGRSAEALAAARRVASRVPADMRGNDWALYETFLSLPLDVMVRFEMWDAILAEPQPPRGRHLWTGMWHYARGMAHAHAERVTLARAELAVLERMTEDPTTQGTLVNFTNAGTLLAIARETLAGELRLRSGEIDLAFAHLERAQRLEDSLPYSEPPVWLTPTRHALGAALLHARRPGEAESVYWQDLARNRENGFALYGLTLALEAQGRTEEASRIRTRFEKAWEAADVTLRPRHGAEDVPPLPLTPSF
jgi:tetratricopeptide (TPR) repeat protein